MFTRRRLQRYLNENAAFVSQSTLHDWVNRLNVFSDDHAATEWEIVLLHAFASLGRVQHEPELGRRRLDLVFASSDGKLSFAADIVTISDQQLHRENPIEAFWEELRRRAQKANVRNGGFSFRVAEKPQPSNLARGNQRSLLLPRAAAFRTHVFNSAWADFLQLVRAEPNRKHGYRAHCEAPAVDVSISYHPGKFGVFQSEHGTYTSATVVDDNPLFNGIKVKARQLKASGHSGARGIIACDGGCRMLTSSANWSTYSVQEVVIEFFRQHRSVDFVVTIAIKSGISWDRPDRVYRANCFVSPYSFLSVSDLDSVVARAVRSLPPIELAPENARHALKWERWGGYGPLGGWSMGGNKVKISARDLLALMAGRLEQKRFVKNHDLGANNIFELHLKRGQLIVGATVERLRDEDDDWIVFEFGDPDPAVAPFSEPTARPR